MISQKRLEAAFRGHGRALRGLLTRTIDPLTYSDVETWVAQCYNMPRHQELIEHAINQEIEGFGVEAIEAEGEWDRYYGPIVALYINMGDTYATTLLYDVERDSWYITSCGDWVETAERNRRYRF